MKEFNVGDRVIVKDSGCSFTTYRNFFKENNLEKWEPFYAEHNLIPKGKTYEVVGKGKHNHDLSYGPLYVLKAEDGKIYIGNNGRKDYMELVQEDNPIKAYDLMKLAAENPQEYKGRKYRVISSYACGNMGEQTHTICIDANGEFGTNDFAGNVYVSRYTELEEIKPEPQPVPFMDAVKAYSEGKKIRCEVVPSATNQVYEYEPDGNEIGLHGYKLATCMGMCTPVTTKEILEGKWYICE